MADAAPSRPSSNREGRDLSEGQEVSAYPPSRGPVAHSFSYSFEEGNGERPSYDIELVAEVPDGDSFDGECSTGDKYATPSKDDESPGSSRAPGGTSAAKSAATAAVAAVSTVAAGTAAKQLSRRLPGPVNKVATEAIKSTQRSLKIDTSSPSVDKSTKSPSTVATSPASTVHTIEVVNKTTRSVGCFWLFFQKKYVVAFLVLALISVTIFLLSEYLAIPGLNQQIKALENEVDRLTEQVDRLEKENDRFEQLNDELAANNDEYSAQNDRLERSNAFYSELNNQLNTSNMELLALNQVLNASNVEYGRLNEELTNTIGELNEQVDILEVVNSNLTATLLEYIKLNEGLSQETDTLDRLNADLSQNLLDLNGALTDLREENGRLVGLLNDLGTIASFLNETSVGLEQSYEYIANYLAEQIVANRAILSETLHNTFRQQTINWVCGLSIKFATEEFASDGTLPIGSEAYPEVISYIESHVLAILCLDKEDFEFYLASEVGDDSFPPTNANMNTVMTSVMMYTTDAMDYYFPDAGEKGGLTESDWADASFRCENLSEEDRFLYNA